jgi:hypothetical protein
MTKINMNEIIMAKINMNEVIMAEIRIKKNNYGKTNHG